MPRARELAADNRALGVGLVVFAGMIVIAAFLFFLLFLEGLNPMIDAASSHSETTKGQDQIDLAKQIAAGMGIYAMALAVMFLLARSVVESRGPG